jgi:hypothetical protein
MPDAKHAPDLEPMPLQAELLAAKRAGLTLVQYRAVRDAQAAGVPVTMPRLEADESNADRLEKAEQQACWDVFRAFGGRVYSLSQSRAAKQTPGLGDGFVIFPGLTSFWWETKRETGGRVSPAQQEFHELCNASKGSWHFIGGRREAEELVIALGIATRGEDGSLYPVRKTVTPIGA